jgi:predicted Zn-dependent protease
MNARSGQLMRRSGAGAALLAVALLMPALLTTGCSTNPATGKSQIALIGEQQEVAMGRDADKQIVAQLGLYPDDELQAYVNRLGQSLARDSERPNLPWTFRVVDDPVVNAFALPGGFIYVTRGLLTHLTSEAELVAVLGHEIGHVTGRHSVEQMSKQQLAQVGLIAGAIASPEFARYADLAQTGLGLMFLKYGRDDEREADSLGLRYLVKDNYDPREMPQVFETLGRVSAQQGAGRVPGWLSTHPAPENRVQRISSEIAALNQDFSQATVGQERYLAQIDGVVFGPNPREGYFVGNQFIHPELGFQVRFPQGWKTVNQKQAVGATSPREDAIVVLGLTQQNSPQAAAQAFFSQQGIQQGQALSGGFGGLPAVARVFGAQQQNGELRGVAAFVEQDGRVFQLLGYTSANNWNGYDDLLAGAVSSFSRVTDRAALDVKPRRVDIVTIPSAMTLREFNQRFPSTVDLDTLAIINQAQGDTRLPAGSEVKRVVGGAPDAQARR